MSIEILTTVVAILISWLVFVGLVRLIKVAAGTAFKLAVIIFVVQIFFGIGPEMIWQRVVELSQQVFSGLK